MTKRAWHLKATLRCCCEPRSTRWASKDRSPAFLHRLFVPGGFDAGIGSVIETQRAVLIDVGLGDRAGLAVVAHLERVAVELRALEVIVGVIGIDVDRAAAETDERARAVGAPFALQLAGRLDAAATGRKQHQKTQTHPIDSLTHVFMAMR